MSERLILSLLAMISGIIFGVGSLIILFKQKFFLADKDTSTTEVEIPFFGRIKTNYPSLVLSFLSAFLIGYPVYSIYQNPELIPISGKVELKGQPFSDGIIIGIIPDNYKVVTNSDGSFKVDVVRNEHSYIGMAYYRSGEKTVSYTAGITMSKDFRSGKFNCQLTP